MTDTTSAAPSDAEIGALAAEHLKSFAQFSGAGDVRVEGEVAFARAVLARWGAQQPAAREPLTDDQITVDGLMMTPNSVLENCATAFEAGVRFAERAHGIQGGQHGDAE